MEAPVRSLRPAEVCEGAIHFETAPTVMQGCALEPDIRLISGSLSAQPRISTNTSRNPQQITCGFTKSKAFSCSHTFYNHLTTAPTLSRPRPRERRRTTGHSEVEPPHGARLTLQEKGETRVLLLGWRTSLIRLEAITCRLEAIAETG